VFVFEYTYYGSLQCRFKMFFSYILSNLDRIWCYNIRLMYCHDLLWRLFSYQGYRQIRVKSWQSIFAKWINLVFNFARDDTMTKHAILIFPIEFSISTTKCSVIYNTFWYDLLYHKNVPFLRLCNEIKSIFVNYCFINHIEYSD